MNYLTDVPIRDRFLVVLDNAVERSALTQVEAQVILYAFDAGWDEAFKLVQRSSDWIDCPRCAHLGVDHEADGPCAHPGGCDCESFEGDA